MKANVIATVANAINGYAVQTAKEHVLIATEFVTPATADNRALGAIYYASQWALAIESMVKCRKAYKANGWTGVGKQYLLSAGKAWAVDHVVRRNIAAIMAANVLAAEKAATTQKTETTVNTVNVETFGFNVDVDQIVKNAMAGMEANLQSSL